MSDDITVRIDVITGKKRLAGSIIVPKSLYDDQDLIDIVEMKSCDLLADMLDALEDELNNE